MTDEQIIKALECCNDGACEYCPIGGDNCIQRSRNEAIKLINHQKAEIERLELALSAQKAFNLTKPETVEEVAKYYSVNKDIIKSEAIKEFAERLKEKASSVVTSCQGYEIYETKQYNISAVDLDNLVKEMVGEE